MAKQDQKRISQILEDNGIQNYYVSIGTHTQGLISLGIAKGKLMERKDSKKFKEGLETILKIVKGFVFGAGYELRKERENNEECNTGKYGNPDLRQKRTKVDFPCHPISAYQEISAYLAERKINIKRG